MAQREIAPAPSLSHLVNLLTPPPANPTLQRARLETLNLDHDLFGTLAHGGDVMGFQTEQFPDKGFY
jgi:hypothetical protein